MSEKLLSLLPPFALLCIGLGSAWVGSSYEVGTLTTMGPGFLPLVLGLCLALLAAILLWLEKPAELVVPLSLRPLLCVGAGVLTWILLAERLGFVPAGLAQIALSSLAMPRQNWLVVVALAAGLTGAAYALFVLVLGLPLPAFGT